MMKNVSVAEHIQHFWIDELKDIVYGIKVEGQEKPKKYPYMAFSMIGIGIEFLGKVLAHRVDWHQEGHSSEDFNYAIMTLNALRSYRPFAKKSDVTPAIYLYSILRCGLAHASLPGNDLRISDNETEKLTGSPITLNVVTLYENFKAACEEVLEMLKGPVPATSTEAEIPAGSLYQYPVVSQNPFMYVEDTDSYSTSACFIYPAQTP